MKKFELLAPAGNSEKLKTAFYFGADACYFAGKQFGLRAFSDNFADDELKEFVNYAHALGKKAFITVNILAHNSDLGGLDDYLKYLDLIKVDAIIVSDPGIISVAKRVAPNLEIHLSTQANCTNYESAKFWVEQGVKRLILARELSIDEIAEIRQKVDPNTDIETFVHGAMCISYSGRCLLSNYLCNRDSNRGACVQACRWEYQIREVNRKDDFYDIQEDSRGTYILNSKDLNMIEHLDKLAQAGVTSFKIEGRMKTSYYVANVVNAYRRALDILESGKEFILPEGLAGELEKSSHRRYSTGFYFGDKGEECLESSTPVSTHDFVAEVVEPTDANGMAVVEHRNKFSVGETLEILSPTNTFNKQFEIKQIINEKNENVESAIKVQEHIKINCPYALQKGDLLRKQSK